MNGRAPKEREAASRRMEALISDVLRAGVLLSAGVILLGVALFALRRSTGYAVIQPHHLGDMIAFHQKRGPGFFPTAPRDVLAGAAAGKPWAVVGLGMLLLIATPVVRVGLSLALFAAERDWLYVGITALVLGVLILSLAVGAG